jgi:CheY-like chemotaxis protein
MDKIASLEQELGHLGLLAKGKEIYLELGENPAISYIKSSYRLLSKVYHPDLNPNNKNQANLTQQRLNMISRLVDQMSDKEIVSVFKKDATLNPFQRKKKILVVEDEFGLQEILSNIFLMEGYEVRVAIDGEVGYEMFCQFEPDLLFADVLMPKMNGLELVRKIRQVKPNIKVIFTSGFFGIDELRDELNQEIIKYNYPTISKPFKLSAMLKIVDSYLSEKKTGKEFVRGI